MKTARGAPVVVSVEQALAMPYATLRFVQLGWRVIKVEPAPAPGRPRPGDPNRYIGRPAGGPDLSSYFVAPNAGKEAVAIDLKRAAGRAVLRRLIEGLGADVFCTNTLPAHHEKLGIDEASLRAVKSDLVWAAISACGTNRPEVPGYDPVVQAVCGYMDLTGEKDGPPLQCGPPIIDLKAGDEVFSQVVLALWERERSGRGKRIDVSMYHAAVSWLQTFLPMLDLGSPPEELRRHGNEHRQFIPVNAYRTRDGWIFVAVGSDAQWRRLVARPAFAGLARPEWESNEGRRRGRAEVHRALGAILAGLATSAAAAELAAAGIPHGPITPIERVFDLPELAGSFLETEAPDGRRVRLPPPAVPTAFLEARGRRLPYAPAYGRDTERLLLEVGFGADEVAELARGGVVHGAPGEGGGG